MSDAWPYLRPTRRVALTLSAPAGPIRLGAFRGPGTASQTFAGALGALSEHRPNVVFVLGGLGASAEVVAASLHALAALPFIVVVIPGGDDPAEIFGEAIDEARTNAPNLSSRVCRLFEQTEAV